MAVSQGRAEINRLLKSKTQKHTLLLAAHALSRRITMYEALFSWPALTESLRQDAENLRKKANGTDI